MVSVLLACSDEKNMKEHGERHDLIEWMLDPVTPGNVDDHANGNNERTEQQHQKTTSSTKCLRKPVYDMASELPLVLWDCSYHNYDASFSNLNADTISNLEK